MIELSQKYLFPFGFSDRAKFRLRGADRLRFLNVRSQTTWQANETAAIEPAFGMRRENRCACLHCAMQDAYLIEHDADLREAFPARLDRYIIADDVQVEDVTDEFDLFIFWIQRTQSC